VTSDRQERALACHPKARHGPGPNLLEWLPLSPQRKKLFEFEDPRKRGGGTVGEVTVSWAQAQVVPSMRQLVRLLMVGGVSNGA